jgi:hypothetical protein
MTLITRERYITNTLLPDRFIKWTRPEPTSEFEPRHKSYYHAGKGLAADIKSVHEAVTNCVNSLASFSYLTKMQNPAIFGWFVFEPSNLPRDFAIQFQDKGLVSLPALACTPGERVCRKARGSPLKG